MRYSNRYINKICIKLASPDSILRKSYGEITKPETINYRTHKPERNGLFCEKIFGPVKDYTCACGKYNGIRYIGIFCDKCGVEITNKIVRRKRIGHIKLVVPIVHIWFFRCLPNKISYLLGKTSKEIDDIIYYEKYVIINVGAAKYINPSLNKFDLISEEEKDNIFSKIFNNKSLRNNKDKFIAFTGGMAIREMLKLLDLDNLSLELKHSIKYDRSKQRRKEALKRLQIVKKFISGNKVNSKSHYMVLKVLPVIPPDLRPLVPLDSGRYASSDLNDFYRKIIIRNNRLRQLVSIQAPNIILKNEKRMLQESVDALLDNSRKTFSVRADNNNRLLKSLSDSLKGKHGRFRQNLLGKRVDYSGRSVIVVDPKLKLHECGLPKDMASELYKPFIIKKLIERGIASTVRSAKKMIDKKKRVIWDILKNMLLDHPVLLNRAPTLHRLGIQAFQAKLINEKSIHLHPLVCSAFNADFDGDQMAVHIPLSNKAILESKLLILSTQNIRNPANGEPITLPSQDMILGLNYMTKIKINSNVIRTIFSSKNEVLVAYNSNIIKLHDTIKLRIRKDCKYSIIKTTVGRVLFNLVTPKKTPFINKLLTKNTIKDIISDILDNTDADTTSKFLDKIKELGFNYAFKGGLSFRLNDVDVIIKKNNILSGIVNGINEINYDYSIGGINNNERYNKILNLWNDATNEITKNLISYMKRNRLGFNPVYMMINSGARGSKEQIRQIFGMRGLIAKPQKSSAVTAEIIETPILSSFYGGLSILEYFISTHGARKGLADTALKTADAGYLTRRLVDVSQDIIITEYDCNTLKGITIYKSINTNDFSILKSKILGRVILKDIYYPNTYKILIKYNTLIDNNIFRYIKYYNVYSITIRSPLTCNSKSGICSLCYGVNLSTNKLVRYSEPVGVIAAQSIGEPGTQLTLRTFHVGGTAGNISELSQIISKFNGTLIFKDIKIVYNEDNNKYIVISRYGYIKIIDKRNMILCKYNIPYGAFIYFKHKSKINVGDKISDWDLYNTLIIAEINGKIYYNNIIKNTTYFVKVNTQTKSEEKIISDLQSKNIVPSIMIVDNNEIIQSYNLSVGTKLCVNDKENIIVGKILAKIPRKYIKSSDITGGLPRLSELFEVRNVNYSTVLSEITGKINITNARKGYKKITVTNNKLSISYIVKISNQILVQNGDTIKSGLSLCGGRVSLNDLLRIKGLEYMYNYLIDQLQSVYKLQGVNINDKHFEIIIKQMTKKLEIIDSGETNFLVGSLEYISDFHVENSKYINKRKIIDIGNSINFKVNDIVDKWYIYNENDILKESNMKIMKFRKVKPAIGKPVLQGITRSAIQTKSFISAASFQETTKVLSESAISGKVDLLNGLKENVIIGQEIPAGTGRVK